MTVETPFQSGSLQSDSDSAGTVQIKADSSKTEIDACSLPSPQSQPKSESPDIMAPGSSCGDSTVSESASSVNESMASIATSITTFTSTATATTSAKAQKQANKRKDKALDELLKNAEWMNSSIARSSTENMFSRKRANTKRNFFTFEEEQKPKSKPLPNAGIQSNGKDAKSAKAQLQREEKPKLGTLKKKQAEIDLGKAKKAADKKNTETKAKNTKKKSDKKSNEINSKKAAADKIRSVKGSSKSKTSDTSDAKKRRKAGDEVDGKEQQQKKSKTKQPKVKEANVKEQSEIPEISGYLISAARMSTPQLQAHQIEQKQKDSNLGFFLDHLDKVEVPIGDRKLFTDVALSKDEDLSQDIKITSASTFVNTHRQRYIEYFENNDVITLNLDSVVHPFLKEEFTLLHPRDEELDPIFEIGKTMHIIALMYLPKQYQLEVVNESVPDSCILGQYAKAVSERNLEKCIEAVAFFSFLLLKLQRQGIIKSYLAQKQTFSRCFIHELLCQIYARTVSPLSKKLRQYKAFSNNVYGEILPNFFSTMLNKVNASHKLKFIDLGSGVGNCVMQAALEFGCASYGAEIMDVASAACEAQEAEFKERTKYYGLNHGKVEFFLRESFIGHEKVSAVIPEIDIVLVNNYVFEDQLNEAVGILLNSLKPGSKIISLKNFVKPGHTITAYNASSIVHKLIVEEHEFESGSVSWTNSGGKYYISTVTEKYQQDVWNDHTLVRTRSHRK